MSVTFLTPHQRPNSGGVYTIERFAEETARWMPVTLVVLKGEPRDLPGVTAVGGAALETDALPDADAILVPADSPALDRVLALPPRKGTVVLFLQGYGEPGNPTVTANLGRARRVMAGAEWLVDAARAEGCVAELVRYGLDRALFFSETAPRARAPVLGVMAGTAQWKGTADAIEALTLIRESVPDGGVRVFGNEDPGIQGASFLAAPPGQRPQIAALMRACSVFMCSSWEEGFGLPGIEAISCGAALATTETKGSRDYAFDRRTALVSEPRDPAALARNVVELLGDGELRERLVAQGRDRIEALYPPWSRAGESFLAALWRLRSAPLPCTR